MENVKELTIDEVLMLPQFKQAIFVSGHKGTNKVVTWVHVLEHTFIKDFINGHELVLTTGARWENDRDPVIFLEHLIEKNVSALCIQLGEKYNRYRCVEDLPRDLTSKAESANFPLIVFPEDYDCRFIDLIHNIHSLIINQNYKQLLDQERFIEGLYQILLNPYDMKDILNYLHKYLNISVAYLKNQEKPLFVPKAPINIQNKILDTIKYMQENNLSSLQTGNLNITCRNVSTLKQDSTLLCIYSDQRQLNNYDNQILDKCVFNLSKTMLDALLNQEKEQYRRNQWIEKWLNGQLGKQEIGQKLQEEDPFLQPTGCAVCLVSFPQDGRQQDIQADKMFRITGAARAYFEESGFKLLCFMDQQNLLFVLINTLKHKSWKNRLTAALNRIMDTITSNAYIQFNESIFFSVGDMYSDLNKLATSHKNAQETLYIQNKYNKPLLLFYDDLHVCRLIISLEKTGDLESFVVKYLEPILKEENDKEKSILLDTVIALRDCQYNKIEAAKHLFISRQSIYQRIKTLQTLLGEDFCTNPQKRICLETALYGLDHIKNETRKTVESKIIDSTEPASK